MKEEKLSLHNDHQKKHANGDIRAGLYDGGMVANKGGERGGYFYGAGGATELLHEK
jgi:hypothetical protein